jgi:hypothetical protein
MRKKKRCSITWQEWGGGPNWGQNCYYLFEPRATNYNPVVTPFIGRPMMRFLNTYATGHSWPTASGAWLYIPRTPEVVNSLVAQFISTIVLESIR